MSLPSPLVIGLVFIAFALATWKCKLFQNEERGEVLSLGAEVVLLAILGQAIAVGQR